MTDKAAIRAAAAARRDALTADERRERSTRATRHLLDAHLVSGTVALYAAFRSEVDPRDLEAAASRVAYPRVEDGHIVFRAARLTDLVPGTWRIPEPIDAHPIVPLSDLDVVIVPGLAFTAAGDRLGYGAGHYDRVLAALRPDARAYALAFATQIVEHLPVEPHDRPVHAVATESGLLTSDDAPAIVPRS